MGKFGSIDAAKLAESYGVQNAPIIKPAKKEDQEDKPTKI